MEKYLKTVVFSLIAFFCFLPSASAENLFPGSALHTVMGDAVDLSALQNSGAQAILLGAYVCGNDGMNCSVVVSSFKQLLAETLYDAMTPSERASSKKTPQTRAILYKANKLISLTNKFCQAGAMDRANNLDYRLQLLTLFTLITKQ